MEIESVFIQSNKIEMQYFETQNNKSQMQDVFSKL